MSYYDNLYDWPDDMDDIYGAVATQEDEDEPSNLSECFEESGAELGTIRRNFKVLRSHLLEELESEVTHHLNEGWTLTGNLHHIGYVDGTIEYMWGVVRNGEEANK